MQHFHVLNRPPFTLSRVTVARKVAVLFPLTTAVMELLGEGEGEEEGEGEGEE